MHTLLLFYCFQVGFVCKLIDWTYRPIWFVGISCVVCQVHVNDHFRVCYVCITLCCHLRVSILCIFIGCTWSALSPGRMNCSTLIGRAASAACADGSETHRKTNHWSCYIRTHCLLTESWSKCINMPLCILSDAVYCEDRLIIGYVLCDRYSRPLHFSAYTCQNLL